jgi:hypothetical protein
MLFSLAIAFNKIKVKNIYIYQIHGKKQNKMEYMKKLKSQKKKHEIKLGLPIILTNQNQLNLL